MADETRTETEGATESTPTPTKKKGGSKKKGGTKAATKKKAAAKKKGGSDGATKKAPGRKRSPGGVVWSDKRIAFVKALKALKATSPDNARPATAIAEKSGLELQHVKHYGYKDEQLAQAGLIGITQVEGVTGLAYYLTAAGQKAEMK